MLLLRTSSVRCLIGVTFLLVLFRCFVATAEIADPWSRAHDMRQCPYSRWPFKGKDVWVDLKLSGTVLNGNVSEFFIGGGVESYVKLGGPHRLFVQGTGNFTSFNDQTLVDKEYGSLYL